MSIIDVSDLRIWDQRNDEEIIKGLSFSVKEHSCLAIVGESGSGKSMTVKAISGIHKPWICCGGSIMFSGMDLLKTDRKKMRQVRGKQIFMIFQDGMSAFDPSCTIKSTLREILLENLDCSKYEADSIMLECMKKVLLKNPAEILKKYPHQLSGGMLQRIMISLAIALQPEIIIADEPTTSLDTITQYVVINEFLRVKEQYGTAMIFISHDLGVVRKIADYIVVMRDGKMVEAGPAEELFCNPKQEYTRYLVDTRKALGENYKKLFTVKEHV